MILLDGDSLNLDKATQISKGSDVVLGKAVRTKVLKSRKFVKELAKKPEAIYGVNTGFGYLAKKRIDPKQLRELQHNIIKSHASGYGDPLTEAESRLAMGLRLNVLAKGYTGVRYRLLEALRDLINANIIPIIPEYGSVGASGDLSPLAHLALPLIGLGRVRFRGKEMESKRALKLAKLSPVRLEEKEGLSLVNGTQIMLSVGTLALIDACALLRKAEKVLALTYEGMEARLQALHPRLHELRGHAGQVLVAERLRQELDGSDLYRRQNKGFRVQDPYSMRCAPQVYGATWQCLQHGLGIVGAEFNAATDNPLVFPDEGLIISGGNFHGQALAAAFDYAAIGVSEIASLSERRLDLMFNPEKSQLPAFLTPYEGTNSGYMAAQYLSASLLSEIKLLTHPASTDSLPGNVGVEDHVSMGPTAARKLKTIIARTKVVLAVELLAAAQAVDLRKLKVGKLGKGTQDTYKKIRAKVPTLRKDRIISIDIEKAVAVIEKL